MSPYLLCALPAARAPRCGAPVLPRVRGFPELGRAHHHERAEQSSQDARRPIQAVRGTARQHSSFCLLQGGQHRRQAGSSWRRGLPRSGRHAPRASRRLVELLGSPMTLTRDDPDASPPQIAPDLAAVVALVGYHPLRTQFGPSTSWALDRSLLHQRLEDALVVPLPRRQDERHRFAPTFRSQMDLGAKSTSTAA
jgi:hypothetical protein